MTSAEPEATTSVAGGEGEMPFVSVIMAVRNEEGYIGPCLQALAQQDYPREGFEVIVLDGESTDATRAEAEQAAEDFGVPDAFLTNRRHTTATGLNLGLSIARGSVVIKVDGHTLVDPHFISASVEALRRERRRRRRRPHPHHGTRPGRSGHRPRGLFAFRCRRRRLPPLR